MSNNHSNESNTSTVELIKRLSVAVGVTGYSGSQSIYEVLAAELKPYVDEVERDRVGSLIGLKRGFQAGESRRKIMLAAHLDEIGAVVTQIDRGVLRFSQVGGLDDRVLMGQEVMVYGRRPLPGVIGSVPPHLLPPGQSNNTVKQDHMHIDVGLPHQELEAVVAVGDLIAFTRTPDLLLNDLISGKAMDNRSSMAAMILCLQALNKLRHQWDVYAVATADEEWGRYVGATTQAYAIRPDVAIVIDVSFADVEELEVKLDEGPVITVGPSNHPVLRQRLLDLCRDLELKYQSEAMPGGAGTDAYAIEISREGVPTILISIPSRYMHSPVEVVHPKDVERTGRLMAHFIAGLDEAFVDTLIPT